MGSSDPAPACCGKSRGETLHPLRAWRGSTSTSTDSPSLCAEVLAQDGLLKRGFQISVVDLGGLVFLVCLVCFVIWLLRRTKETSQTNYFVWLLWLVWFNQINQTNIINQINVKSISRSSVGMRPKVWCSARIPSNGSPLKKDIAITVI
jgi:hypothetical protein